MRTALRAVELNAAIVRFADGLERHQATINRLNVFPVPDGDTGTNMLATVAATRDALTGLDGATGEAMGAVCAEISRAALMGARGNSGVILCQILRGIADVCARVDEVDAPRFADALDAGARSAYEAVQRPAAGTILTVASAAASGALACARGGASLAAVVAAARDDAIAALWATPEQLPVLADAGVVDAGGAGLVLLYDGFCQIVTGQEPISELPLPEAVRASLGELGPVIDARASASEQALRYEVMYLLETDDAAVPGFRRAWATIGDSIVVVGGGGLWNCHIHTDEIGAAIEAAIDVGRPRDIRVTDLSEQVEEERWVRNAVVEHEASAPVGATSVVAVASGEGIARIFRSLGVATVIAGGQSMNPSTAELLEAIAAAPAREVVVLPNNANIFPVAHQAADLADDRVVVVETAGVQEALSALIDYDPDASATDNGVAMAAAAARVRAGEVTRAVRSSATAAGAVAAGDWIALDREGIVAIAESPAAAACSLIDVLAKSGGEIVTVIEGLEATEAGGRAIAEWLAQHHPGLVFERHRGGQPLYPYLVAIE